MQQASELADASSILFKHFCSRKLHYLGHIMRQLWDNIEGNLMTGLVGGKRNRGKPRIIGLTTLYLDWANRN